MKSSPSRITILFQAIVGFAAILALFHSLKGISPPIWVPTGSYPASYLAVLMVLLLFAALQGDFRQNLGISEGIQKADQRLLVLAMVPSGLIKAALSFLDWRQWGGALAVSGIIIASTVVFWRVAGESDKDGTGSVLLPMLLVGLIPGVPGITPGWAQTGYRVVYMGLVAFSEETLFRGAIFARLKAAFPEDWTLFRIPAGWPVLISAGLFALWHVISSLLGTAGLIPSLLWGLWTFLLGIFLGALRSKTGGVGVPAILHWIINI